MRLTTIFTFVLFLSGCSNSIAFYQATRASLTVETNSLDVNKPVQGNLGYKNRTFIHNPKKAQSAEVMALISDAQFNVHDNNSGDEVITFRTALISGDAANNLSDSDVAQAVEALSGAKVIPNYSALAKSSFNKLCALSASDFTVAKNTIVFTNYQDLTQGQITKLETQAQVGLSNYKQKLHSELSAILATGECR